MNPPILTASFRKQFSGGPEIRMVDLRVSSGITVLFGASGSGKTTVLRCLAGLERPDDGEIRMGNEVWCETRSEVYLPPRRRRIGFVPQEYALFPHLTVGRNVGYSLHELNASERAQRLKETLNWLGLAELENRLPHELSGGQQQRVALARAVVQRPRLLLLDEPLAALDTPLRLRLRGELRQWLQQVGVPTILVTHDRFETLAFADEVVVLHEGSNVQQGVAHEVFNRPESLAVAEITAVETVQPGRIIEIRDSLATVAVGDARLIAIARDLPSGASDVYVCIRGEDVILMRPGAAVSSSRNQLPAVVRVVTPEGPLLRVNLDCGFPVAALLTRPAGEELALQVGMQLTALVKAPQVHLIPFTRGIS